MPPRDRRSGTPPDNTRLLQLADQANIDDHCVQQLLARGLAVDGPSLRRRIANRLAGKAVEERVNPFADQPPIPSVNPAGILLGTTPTGNRYTLQEDDLTQHLLAVGRSGAGKTTLLYNLMDQVSVSFWSFDLKQDYRHLLHTDIDLLVLPWTRLKFHPLKPPAGVPPRRWAQVFSEIFGHATDLLSGSKNFLMEQLIELYRLYDLFNQVAEPYPSLLELQILVEHAPIN